MNPDLGSRSQPSGTYTPAVIEDIQTKAELGRYRIRGFGTLRPRTWATFDDLTYIPCGLTRIPLEGHRESCSTRTVLGTRHAEKPIELDIPVMITGMSYGALSYNATHSTIGPALLVSLALLAAPEVLPFGAIWLAHVGFDRMLGYGLKYPSAFGHTHLGAVGREAR